MQECAPPEHIAIFGACVLLLVLCCSDRDQRVHVSVVVGVVLAFGVVAVSVVRRPLVLDTQQHEAPAVHQQEHFAPPTNGQPAADRHDRCAHMANFQRFERAERHHHRPVPISRTAVHRRGYSMLR